MFRESQVGQTAPKQHNYVLDIIGNKMDIKGFSARSFVPSFVSKKSARPNVMNVAQMDATVQTGHVFIGQPFGPTPEAPKRKNIAAVRIKAGVAALGIAAAAGGIIAAGVLHSMWVPGLAAFFAHAGAAIGIAGTAVFSASPIGWVVLGIMAAAALVVLTVVGVKAYKARQAAKAEARQANEPVQPMYLPLAPGQTFETGFAQKEMAAPSVIEENLQEEAAQECVYTPSSPMGDTRPFESPQA
jgi:hypothetical protein